MGLNYGAICNLVAGWLLAAWSVPGIAISFRTKLSRTLSTKQGCMRLAVTRLSPAIACESYIEDIGCHPPARVRYNSIHNT